MSGKKRNWRGVSDKVAKDKQDIYNSREWQELRVAKLRSTNGLCEECLKQGITNPARCVHHIVPIETARTKDEMKRLAIDCGLQGLKALCFACHARIHKELGSNTAKIVRQRAEARQDRWADNLMSKFVKKEDNGIQTEIYEGPVRETGANRTYGAQAQTSAEGSGNYQDEMG